MLVSCLKNSQNKITVGIISSIQNRFSDDHVIKFIKNIFGFYPTNNALYKLAFLHRSAAIEIKKEIKISNERLEFLGDSVLSTVIADYLFKRFPYNDEGFLTEMRSKIVSRKNLNQLSQKLGIDKLILKSTETGNIYRSISGDAFEALIGAIYLDKGYDFTRKVIINRIVKNHLDMESIEKADWNYKSKIIDWAQREKKTIGFNVVELIGRGYSKQYVVDILIDNVISGRGQDFSIKAAEQQASENAYKAMFSNGLSC